MHAGPAEVSHAAAFAAAARQVPVTGAGAPPSAPPSSPASVPASTVGISHVPLAEHLASPPLTCPHVPDPVTTVFWTHMLVAGSHASSRVASHPGPVVCLGSHV